jgi:hypothetical protein
VSIMLLAGDEGRILYDLLREHVGHHIEIAVYGAPEDPQNVSIECIFDGVVLIDADRPCCPTCFGIGCGDCINEDGGVDR